jgi:TonB-linked SusC/RagA family outer membrane protein
MPSPVNQNAVLIFSFIGYVSQEIPVGGKQIVNAALVASTMDLDEVVVIGYGTQKMLNLTGSISQISSERLGKIAVPNITKVLQGTVSGLNITTTRFGGEPGAEMDFNIRGVGSLSGGKAYVLVDGVPADMNDLNPNDVESVSVLKDAASAAIYGARAAYGVILITTKSGSRNEKMQASYSNSFSWAAPTFLPESINSLDFAKGMNIAALNSGQAPFFSDETIDRIIQYQADPEHFPSAVMDPATKDWGTYGLTNANTDWYDVYFKDISFSQKHDLNINGGSKNASYYVGFGWMHESGKLNFCNDYYERFNLTANYTANVTEWMVISLKSKFNRGFNNYPPLGGDRTNIWGQVIRAMPTYPVYTPNGDMMLDLPSTPYLAHGGSRKAYTNDLWLTPSIDLNLTKDWTIHTDFSYNNNSSRESAFQAIIWAYLCDGVTRVLHFSQNYNMMTQTLNNNEYYTSNIYTKFEKKLNNHFFSILLGAQAELSNTFLLTGWKRDLISEAVPSISVATGSLDIDDVIAHWSTEGAFMRLLYNFNEKYLFEMNGRYDGSSRFQSGKRWGFFPSASVGYNIWKENFWEPVKSVVNTLKLRASYGSLGNQNVANYLNLEIMPVSTNLSYLINGVRPNSTNTPSNTSIGLTWETSNTLDFGVDAGLLNNRLSFTFDWFKRQTLNMFGPGESRPAVLGASVPQENNATLETKGIELAINWKQSVNADFQYNLNLVLSDNKTVVTQYNNPTKLFANYYEGKVYGEIWGYVTEGLFQSDADALAVNQSQLYSKWTAGDVKYKDLNGDGKITRGTQTLDDPGDMKVIGNSSPRYMYGINVGARYKRFDFSIFWQGIGKRDLWISNEVALWGFYSGYAGGSTIQKHTSDFWTPENTDSYFPKPYLTTENSKNHQVQTRYLLDVSYIRLRNIQLSYTLPSNILGKIKIEKVRISLSGENIFTFSNIHKSFDPETAGGGGGGFGYPIDKAVYVGINVTF